MRYVYGLFIILILSIMVFSSCSTSDLSPRLPSWANNPETALLDRNQTHAECGSSRCRMVPGAGTDMCTEDWECQTEPRGKPIYHLGCLGDECIPIAGPGKNTCEKSCPGSSRHLSCIGNQCRILSGSGPNKCNLDADCSADSLPDLIITSISFSVLDGRISIYSGIKNIGNQDSRLFRVSYIDINAGKKIIELERTLKAGETGTLKMDYSPTRRGTHTIVAEIDSRKIIDESDENNNEFRADYQVSE